METLVQDLRVSLRTLAKSPLFTLPVLLILAAAIGFNGFVFAVADSVLLQPLPYPDPDRLVLIWERHAERQIERNFASRPNYVDWKEQSRSFQGMGAFYVDAGVLTGDDAEPERVVASAASADVFRILGVRPLLGRTFTDEEDRAGVTPVALLAHRLWERRYGGDPSIVNRSITVDGLRVPVVGVMPPGFEFPEQVQLWIPLSLDPEDLGSRGGRSLQVVARLKPGVPVQTAAAEMDAIGRRLAQDYPDANAGWSASVVPLHEDLVGDVRPALLVLLGAVTVVVLIACANVANLLLARSAARQREIALRTALGASRWRLVRQILTESVVLSLAAGALGIFFAFEAIELLRIFQPGDLPRLDEVRIDGRAVAYTFALSLLTGAIFGLAPAITLSKLELNTALKEGSNAIAGRSRRLREGLVVGELALALVLLVGAALLINSFVRLLRIAPGFDPDDLLLMEITLSSARYPEDPQRVAFMAQLVDQVSALQGVRSASMISHLPVTGVQGLWNNSFHVEGRPPLPPGVKIRSHVRWIMPGYFRTMGIPLLAGRDISRRDDATSPNVIVIDEEMKRLYFPDEDPLGKRLVVYFGERVPREIVGVVGTVKQAELGEEPVPHMYIPYAQSPQGYGNLIVRSASDPSRLVPAVKAQLLALDPTQPIDELTTMEERLSNSMAQRRFNLMVLGAFAGMALVLAALGVYAVIAYQVTQRQRELGVRLALGAPPQSVVRLVLGQGMRLVLVGLVLGLLAAVAATRLMAGLLFGIEASNPATYAVVVVVLALVALLATYLPARRAARVDPMIAFQVEG